MVFFHQANPNPLNIARSTPTGGTLEPLNPAAAAAGTALHRRGAVRGTGGAGAGNPPTNFEAHDLQQHGRMADLRTMNRNAKRANPRPRAGKGSALHLRQYADATLGGGSLRKIVQLPEGESYEEWVAVNLVDFFCQINLLYGSMTEFCSPESCPSMTATEEFEFLWQDGVQYPRPTKMSAPAYVENLLAWVQRHLDDEQVFPSRIGVPFPKGFGSLVKNIFKRLFRVYAHIYCHHYPVVRELGLEPHLNTSFKHFVLFVDVHGLASGRDYWGPLGDLVDSMLKSE